MRALLVLVLLRAAPQDDVARLVEQLGDNSPVVRDEAATKLVEGYAKYRKPLEEALARAAELDLKERLREVLADGRRRELRRTVEGALPGRIRKEFPGFAAALYDRDPAVRAGAFRSLQQTFQIETQKCPFPGLFLTPGEMARILPHLLAALDPSPESIPVRHEWVGVLGAHDGLLDRPDWADAARALLLDPSPQVRGHASQNLASRVASPADLAELGRRWPDLDPNERWRVLQEVAARKLEKLYPLFGSELADAERGVYAAKIILCRRVDPLRLRALEVLRREPQKAVFADAFQGTTPEEATPILLAALPGSEGWTPTLLQWIGQYAGPAAGDAVAARLDHADAEVRAAALGALDRTGSPRHAAAVAQALRRRYEGSWSDSRFRDGDAWRLLIRWRAGEEIAGLLEFLPSLNQFTVDFPGLLRSLKLAGAGKKLVPFLRSDDVPFAVRAVELLAAAGAVDDARANLDAIRALIEKKDARIDVLLHAAGELGLKELLPLLLDRLDGVHPLSAARSLALFWTADERRALLRDPDPKVRSAAVLASFEDDLPAFEPLVRDLAPAVRRRLVEVLANSNDARAGPLLVELGKDEDGLLASRAADAYFSRGRVGPRVELLGHPSRGFRVAAAKYLSRAEALTRPDLLRALLADPLARDAVLEANPTLDPDLLSTVVRTIEKEIDADELWFAVYRLEDCFSAAERGPALLRLYERFTDPREFVRSGERTKLGSILDTAAGIAAKTPAIDVAPSVLKLLASDDADRQRGAAQAAWLLGIRAAIPRLVELAGAPDGLAAAEALGRMKALPKELLGHSDLKVRANAVKAAAIAKDPALFDALLEGARGLSRDAFRAALETLAVTAPRDRAVRILELLRRSDWQDRREVFFQLRRLPLAELVEPAAEFLEDNAYVRPSAAQFLMEAGGDRYAERIVAAMGEYSACAVAHYGLRERAGSQLHWLEVPGTPGTEGWALETAKMLAQLGMKEQLPAVVAKMESLKKEERRKMLLPAARLGGRDAVARELRGPDPDLRLAAAEALYAVGATEFKEEIRKVLVDNPSSGLVLIAAMGDRELAEHAIREADRGKGSIEFALSYGDRLGVASARPRLAELFRRRSDMVYHARYAWRPAPWEEADPGDTWIHRTGRATLEKLSREMGREIVFGTPPRDGFDDAFVGGGTMDFLLEAMPYKAYFYIDTRGRAVIDTEERARAGWLERFEASSGK